MFFNSVEFLIFFPAVLLVYYLSPFRLQNLRLLVASYFFYGWWDWRFLSLIALSTVIDYACGLGIERSHEQARRKTYLWVSMASNLLLLMTFKYFNFFYDSALEALLRVGIHAPGLTLKIVLPVGISFYTFQTMSYTIDIYRRELRATRDFLNFALFVSFFPQLVAGPIERAVNLLPQVEQPRVLTGHQITSGFWLMMYGFFKKVAIGDSVAPYVEQIVHDPTHASGPMILGAMYLFAIQIYADFSGYSDIARGTARLLGFELMVNFRQPYLSRSFGEFWRRWHISLSSWFRDYVYIPLGGNRHGKGKTIRNLWITFLVTGFWHGANWTFLVWGALHGVYLMIERWMGVTPIRPYERPLLSSSPARMLKTAAQIFVVFNLAAFAFLIFASPNMHAAWDLSWGLFAGWSGVVDWTNLQRFLFFGAMLLVYDLSQELRRSDEPSAMFLPAVLGGIVAALILLAIFIFGGTAQAFIYFQF